MKKSIIAGASVLALAGAVMPMAGVFAADGDVKNVVDTINITVEKSCSFKTSSTATLNGTYTATGVNGADLQPSTSGEGGTNVHTFNVFCNDNKGYTVSATAYDLANIDDASPAITDVFAYKADLSGLTTTSGWHAEFASITSGITAGSLPDSTGTPASATGVIITRTNTSTETAGDSWKATYSAKVGSETKAGTYEGTISYTLAPSGV